MPKVFKQLAIDVNVCTANPNYVTVQTELATELTTSIS